MNDTITKDELPTSFGTFNPVGHLMIGLPGASQFEAAAQALRSAGWQDDELVAFTPRESIEEFEKMLDAASGAAGFGYEITLQRRYLELARQGYRWLLVKVDGADAAARAAAIVRVHGATLAVHYRGLIVEELI